MSHLFTVIARLSCQLDRNEPVSLGSVRIGPLPEDLNFNLNTTRLHSTSRELDAYALVIQAQDVEFETSTFYWTQVSAANADAAIHKVLRDVDPLVRVVLSEATGHLITTQPLIAIGEQEGNLSAYSHPMEARFSRVVAPNLDRMTRLFRQLESDPKFRAACRLLTAAQTASEAGITGGQVATNAALLEYAKCLELLAKDLRLAVTPDVDRQREALVCLKNELNSDDHQTQLEAVKRAATTLYALTEPSMKDRVRNLAETLGLEEEWTTSALALVAVRNDLAHPRVRDKIRSPAVDGAMSPHQVVIRAISAFAAYRSSLPSPEAIEPLESHISHRLWWSLSEGTILERLRLEARRRKLASEGGDPGTA